ncbi:distal tail protein Dit [Clostridium uliginosum]|uniref:Putative phage tail component, N-terminal domain-containing protein n=1 Tax=Clostridium uliginosum TaxID=119641 RepID=A0A1I1GUB4_9CLOT|nr:distal tail protein Dit [Clostridium uliginosum]SFC15274.1 putative phage tail component, N-terminal domain-containing protein [Clostridium uliginosum]
MGYDIIFNMQRASDLDLEVVKRPFIPLPKRRFKTKDIEGHDGSYFIDEGTYEDMTISIEFNFIEDDLDNIRQRVRNIMFWLENIIDNKLKLDDNWDYYYKVKKVEVDNFGYGELYEIQNFTATFTVEPYQYLSYSKKEKPLYKNMHNAFYMSKPIYRIVGIGNCNFTVNGTTINCNVDKELIIDTENDKILEADKTLAIGKTNIKAMQDLYLRHGINNISLSDGFKAFYTPNYRVI